VRTLNRSSLGASLPQSKPFSTDQGRDPVGQLAGTNSVIVTCQHQLHKCERSCEWHCGCRAYGPSKTIDMLWCITVHVPYMLGTMGEGGRAWQPRSQTSPACAILGALTFPRDAIGRTRSPRAARIIATQAGPIITHVFPRDTHSYKRRANHRVWWCGAWWGRHHLTV